MSSADPMNSVFVYVVDRDFGFAPNPFHGYCTLATCKPHVRKQAQIGDWVIGMGGSRLRATGRCVFAMRVTDKTTFDGYWADRRHIDKRPIRNGSSRSMVGDNIYHYDKRRAAWRQADSHHSNTDGTINQHNLANDTKSQAVLISAHFYYFGRGAPAIPPILLRALGYKNRRQHFRFPLEDCADLLAWLDNEYRLSRNLVLADPFDFDQSHSRFDGRVNRVS